jgi:hypothetical protein
MNGSRKCGIYILDFYSTIRSNNNVWFGEGKWMQLEGIMLSKASQAQKDKGCVLSLIHGRQIQKINIYTKASMMMYNLYVEHVFNS